MHKKTPQTQSKTELLLHHLFEFAPMESFSSAWSSLKVHGKANTPALPAAKGHILRGHIPAMDTKETNDNISTLTGLFGA